MTKFLADVATPYWWVSVFLVGIVINLISHRAARLMDALVEKRRRKRDDRHNENVATAYMLTGAPSLLALTAAQIMERRLSVVLVGLAGVVMMVTTFVVPLPIQPYLAFTAATTVIFALAQASRAMALSKTVDIAYNILWEEAVAAKRQEGAGEPEGEPGNSGAAT